MKTTSIITKIVATALALCFALCVLVGCGGSNSAAMTLTKDGKTYVITEAELGLLMKIRKLDYCCQLYITTSVDTPELWADYADDEQTQTYGQFYTSQIHLQTQSILAEKYLFDLYGLELSKDTLDGFKTSAKTAAANYGGKGAYKQYFGYTAEQYYDTYMPMVERSEALVEYLYGENGVEKVTADEKETYFNDNYVAYQFIMLDMTTGVKVDENGDRVRKTDTDEDGNEILLDEYETVTMTEDEKAEKQLLAKLILTELEKGASFEELVMKYSDDYASVKYIDGAYALKDGTFINATVTQAIEGLEIGEVTPEAISVSSDAYQYIVKRVELVEGAYENDTYADLFEDFEDTVKFAKYEEKLNAILEEIVVDTTVTAKYTIEDTFLSPYADDYYAQIYSQYISSLTGS